MTQGLAIIPTIFASEHLGELCQTLVDSEVDVILVDNQHPTSLTQPLGRRTWLMRRYGWSIYKTWNFGLRLGAYKRLPTLILNDDVTIEPEAVTYMLQELRRLDYAILGFDYKPGPRHYEVENVRGSYRHGGIGGFAFGTVPWLCARVDRRFKWWGGDDDLFFTTLQKGGRIGLLPGATVIHHPSTTASRHPDLLPEGWYEHDRALLKEKWNDPF